MYLGYLDTVRVPEHPHPLPLTRHFTPNPTTSKYPCWNGHFSSFNLSIVGRSLPYRRLFIPKLRSIWPRCTKALDHQLTGETVVDAGLRLPRINWQHPLRIISHQRL